MMKKTTYLNFDDVFPNIRGIHNSDKKKKIELAKNVAKALEKEREKIVKEKQDNSTYGFFHQITR